MLIKGGWLLRIQRIEKDMSIFGSELERKYAEKKNQEWENRCAEINHCIGNSRSNKAWKCLRSLRTQNKDKSSLDLKDISSWENHFQNLQTETRTKFKSAEDRKEEERVEGDAMTDEFPKDITVEKVKKALHGMKNGKAPGLGEIPIELLNYISRLP